MGSDFEDAIRSELALIDDYLASLDIDLSTRPLHAAAFYVEHCVVEIQGDSKDQPYGKPWFADICQIVLRWYQARYGDRLKGQDRQVLVGPVMALSTPFLIRIPLVTQSPAKDKGQFWVCFPVSVQSDEHPLEWLIDPPNLAAMSPDARGELEAGVAALANTGRTLAQGLRGAIFATPHIHALAQGIIPHFNRGAELVLADRQVRSLAVWELHLAVEKSMKLFLMQKGADVPKIHDLRQLLELAVSGGCPPEMQDRLSLLPTDREAIACRYAENEPMPAAKLVGIYRTALEFAGECVTRLDRRLGLSDFRVLLRSPFSTESAQEAGGHHTAQADREADDGSPRNA